MSHKIVFYHNPKSRAAIVHWMLEEAGADYETRLVDFQKGDNRTPEFLALNPMGKIPMIVVDGTVITEAPAIIAWLADAYPAAGLAPEVGSLQRGLYYRWLFFGGSCIEPALVDQMLHRPPVEQKSALGWGSFDDVLDTVEAGLRAAPWLLGERFSAADVYIGAELGWAGHFGVQRIKDSQLIDDYVTRCRQRPAYLRTLV
ncbi:MAG: glutathione S-transferase family protein [Lautropia sp.]|nr:glutathione S-transferase family protein [Lautropia sp.]